MSLKVVKGFSLQLNLNLTKSQEEEAICLSIEENLPQLVVEQKMCQTLGQITKGKTYLDLCKVCKCQFSQEYLYLVESIAKKNKIEKTIPVQFNNLDGDSEKMKFLTQDQLVNNVILTKNSYEYNEEAITIYDFSNISDLMQLFLNNFWIEFALNRDSNELISKLIFNNVTFIINKIDSSQHLQIVSNQVMQLLASKAQARSTALNQQVNDNQKNLSEFKSIKNTIRTGYLSMDSKLRIVPLLAQDEGVYKVPLIGIWIQSDENVNDIFLWTLFIEYAKNGALKKCNLSNSQSSQSSSKNLNQNKSSTPFTTNPNYQDISFLFVWFQSSDVTNPLFFQIQITQSSINKCFQKAQLSSSSSVIKFDYRYSKFKPVNIIENGLNHTFEAQDLANKNIKQQNAQLQGDLPKQKVNNFMEEKQVDSSRQHKNTEKSNSERQREVTGDRSQNTHQSVTAKSISETRKENNQKDELYKLKSSLTHTSEDFHLNKSINYKGVYGDNSKQSLNDSYKGDSLKLSTRDLNISLNQSKTIDKTKSDNIHQGSKQQSTDLIKVRSQSTINSQVPNKQNMNIAQPNNIECQRPQSTSQKQFEECQKQIQESQKILLENNKQKPSSNSTQNECKQNSEKEKQLYYKSSNTQQQQPNISNNLASFQQNTLKQHQRLFEQNSKIDELEKQIQLLKKELQSQKLKEKLSPRVPNSGRSSSTNNEYSTVKKRSSKSVISSGSNVGNISAGSGGGSSAAAMNTNESKASTKFVSRINQVQMESPSTNIAFKNNLEKVKENNHQSSSQQKSIRNQYSANSQATTNNTGNKSIDSRLYSQNQNNSFNLTNKNLNANKYLNSSSTHINREIDLNIANQSNEKPPLNGLSTARSNQLRSSIKNLTQRLNTQRTSSSKQQQKQQNSGSGSGGANVKRSRFLECNDELPRIKFDFSNIQDNEESDDETTNKSKEQKFISYHKLTPHISTGKSNVNIINPYDILQPYYFQIKNQSFKLNNFIDL